MKIQLKRSNVLDGGKAKEPTASQMEYGELAVNYNVNDPSLFIKNSDNIVVKIADLSVPGDGALTIQTSGGDLATGTFTANQAGASTLTLPAIDYADLAGKPTIPAAANNGALTIKTSGGDSASGTFTANQSGASTLTLPQISYTDLKNVPPDAAAPGNGTITIKQPGTTDQTFTVNQSGNTTINLKNDDTVVTPGNGALTIKTAGENKSATGSFTANQSGASTITLPTIRYGDLSGRPTIPAAANNGQININGGNGITASGTNATANQAGNTTRTLAVDTSWLATNWGDSRYVKKAGDNMTGNLTLATNKITLNTNGNATFAGTVTATVFDIDSLPALP